MRFFVLNLGCKVNRVEADLIAGELLSQGLIRSTLEEADVVAVNTCTVTGEAEKKTRKAVRRVLRENTHALVIVTGCAAAIDEKTFLAMDPRVSVEPDKTHVAALAAERLGKAEKGGSGSKAAQACPTASDRLILRLGDGYRTRVGIKMQDGCDNACTYCIVHVARGSSQSRAFPDICEEVRAYAGQGTHEFVLTGINLGSYHSSGYDLIGALRELLAQNEGVRFRLSSIEPMDVGPDLIRLMAESDGRICRHLHLPLQSGSSKVLKDMARPYDAAQYKRIVEDLYEAIPSISLSTDLIVGFPGETEDDFEQSIRMLESCRFSKVHLFPYSMRTGTPAALRSDQIDPLVKAERITRINAVAYGLREKAYGLRRGKTEAVLVEKQGLGMTESYFPVSVPDDARVGSLVEIRLP